jgi:hypothetical protein
LAQDTAAWRYAHLVSHFEKAGGAANAKKKKVFRADGMRVFSMQKTMGDSAVTALLFRRNSSDVGVMLPTPKFRRSAWLDSDEFDTARLVLQRYLDIAKTNTYYHRTRRWHSYISRGGLMIFLDQYRYRSMIGIACSPDRELISTATLNRKRVVRLMRVLEKMKRQ